MPGRDKTGPEGFGPMTGRGMGYCSGNIDPGYGSGMGRGRGFFRGRGRGFKSGAPFGRGYADYNEYVPAPPSKDEEISALKNRISWYENTIKDLSSRIASLQKDESEQADS